MDLDVTLGCEDFLLPKTSSSFLNGEKNSCAKIPQESPTKLPTCQSVPPELYTTSSSSSMSTALLSQDCRLTKETFTKAPNISYEVALAKSIMQEYSTISGDNLWVYLYYQFKLN